MAANIDSVVFDVGNVLIRWDPRNLYRRLGFTDAATAAILAETGLLEINHRQLDAGAPFGPTIEALATRFPAHRMFLSAFHERWTDMLAGPIEENVALLEGLRTEGVPVYAITNFARDKFDVSRALFPFLDTFDDIVVSADVGLVKPDDEIFELLIARRRLDPSRSVFIDDSAANVATARRLGFHSVHYVDATTDLGAELAELGLPVG